MGLLGKSESIELGLWDALSRTGLGLRGIFLQGAGSLQLEATVETLKERFEEAEAGSPVVAPLALGNHTDHCISSEAAIAKYSGCAMAFYEDLPYAAAMRSHDIESKLADIAAVAGIVLIPLTVSWVGDSEWKERCCSIYRSQLSKAGIDKILGYMNDIKGERLWCSPRFLESWAGKILSGLSAVSCPSLP